MKVHTNSLKSSGPAVSGNYFWRWKMSAQGSHLNGNDYLEKRLESFHYAKFINPPPVAYVQPVIDFNGYCYMESFDEVHLLQRARVGIELNIQTWIVEPTLVINGQDELISNEKIRFYDKVITDQLWLDQWHEEQMFTHKIPFHKHWSGAVRNTLFTLGTRITIKLITEAKSRNGFAELNFADKGDFNFEDGYIAIPKLIYGRYPVQQTHM